MSFEIAWSIYPHYQNRSKRAIAKSKFDQITGWGLNTYALDEGVQVPLTLQAEAAIIIEACKAFSMTMQERQFSPGFHTWLNQGRFLDLPDAERQRLASRYDEKMSKREQHLRLVK